MNILTTAAIENSTIGVRVGFEDDNRDALTPNSVIWKLTDRSGVVINNRSYVEMTPSPSVNIVLSGQDLALPDKRDRDRILTVFGTYNSSYGDNLPYADAVVIPIVNLIGF